MIRFGLNLHQIKSRFFDRPVLSAIDRGKRKALGRFGGFVRKAARWSIRQRKKVSAPGEPPSSHTGILRNFIFYVYEPFRDSVVIGPAKTNQKNAFGYGPNQTIPQVLEYGGMARLLEHEVWPGRWVRTDLRMRFKNSIRNAANRPRRVRWISIQPRPYMHPAFAVGKAKLPEIWADCIK